MAKCDYCGTTILMGGARDGTLRFCNNKCLQNAYLLRASQNVPANVVERKTEEVWRGNCPKCGGLGPIDVHKYHQVWSALVLTQWTSNQQVSCRSCATKRQTGALFFSLALGWWGFPWGLVLTPVQVSRNIIGMLSGPDSSKPSEDLHRLVKLQIGAEAFVREQNAGIPPRM